MVYPRVIYYIHLVAEGYNRKLYKTIACVTCRYVISNHADGFPVSSIIFIGVFPQVDIELYGGALFRTVSRRHFFVLNTCSCCNIFLKSSARLKRPQVTYENDAHNTNYFTMNGLPCFIKTASVHI